MNLRSMELRVGALPQHPHGLLGYASTSLLKGVVNEYLNDCEVVQDGQRVSVPAMGGLETIVTEMACNSKPSPSQEGGTLCETYDGKVSHLNYITIR